MLIATIIRHDRKDLFFLTTVQLNRVQIDITTKCFASLELDLADLWVVRYWHLCTGCGVVAAFHRANRSPAELHTHVIHVISAMQYVSKPVVADVLY